MNDVDRALLGQQVESSPMNQGKILARPTFPSPQQTNTHILTPVEVMRMVEVGILSPKQGFGMIFQQGRPQGFEGKEV